jgi:hypothetical protein
MDIQEINVDSDSTDNSQVIAGPFNECFLSVADKTLPQDSNINSNNNAGISDIKSKRSNTSNSNPAHWLTSLTTHFRTYNSNFQQQRN